MHQDNSDILTKIITKSIKIRTIKIKIKKKSTNNLESIKSIMILKNQNKKNIKYKDKQKLKKNQRLKKLLNKRKWQHKKPNKLNK